MTYEDATSLSRIAQNLVVETRRGYGSPPVHGLTWQSVPDAKVDLIEINCGVTPSRAIISFPTLRWHETFNLFWGDMIRICSDEFKVSQRSVLFVGFLTKYASGFSGGTDEPGTAYERNAAVALDHRWLLSATSPVFGQLTRGPDDYINYGTSSQSPKDNSYIWALGRRCIFNADGRPNRDHEDLSMKVGSQYVDTPIFTDPERAVYWTARQMVRCVLSNFYNLARNYLPITDPANLPGLDHADWDNVLNHIVVDGLSNIDALYAICINLGWSFREDYYNDNSATLSFYKIGTASGHSRGNTVLLHTLHAPAVGEDITTAVSQGKKILWAMDLDEDISLVVNNPLGLGAPQRFEFTAELVPAWLDSDLIPNDSDDYANLYFTEAELQELTDPDSKDYYKYYHPRGSKFERDVGRKWVLNESGHYSGGNYDRGLPFDFATVVPDKYILDSTNKRIYAPFNRRLLPCLTLDNSDRNTVGIRVEFSFDEGSTWQVIPAAITPLKDECGIYIDEANLAELVDQAEGTISGGDLDGKQLNFWTSLCNDKIGGNSFKNGDWYTRVRITASVQLDQRLEWEAYPSPASGSLFWQQKVYDFSGKYHLSKRASSSVFTGQLAADEPDDIDLLKKHLYAIRDANEPMSVSSQFVLDRLWLGDGSGFPDFAIGDGIDKITGREYLLRTSFNTNTGLYPEIIKIIYYPQKQKMKLVTRDLRFAEVTL